MYTLVKHLAVAALTSVITAGKVGPLADLRPLLSHKAGIYLPGSTDYADATTRWDAPTQLGLDLVVKVASEADVQHTVSIDATLYWVVH